MPIKDLEKAREYKRLWIAKKRQGGKNVELSLNVEPKENNFVEPLNVEPQFVEPEKLIVEPVEPKIKSVEPVEPKIKSVEPVEPTQSKVEPEKVVEPCPLCPKLEKRIKELEKPINPTIELWKGRYFDLEKEFHKKGAEQSETILRLKEKLREKDKENKEWEQKYSNLENQKKNQSNYLSVPDLNNLISKHTKIINSQHRYSDKDLREREFLKSLRDKMWKFD